MTALEALKHMHVCAYTQYMAFILYNFTKTVFLQQHAYNIVVYKVLYSLNA